MSGKNLPADIDLPTIDYAKILSGGQARSGEAERLIDAFTNVGFCLLTYPPGYEMEAVFKAIK